KRVEQVSRAAADKVPTHGLERIEGSRVAPARHAGNEQQARQPVLPRIGHQNFRPIRSSAIATFDGAEGAAASMLISGTRVPRMTRSRLSSGKRWMSLV